jgi:hypothetical protein
MRSKEAVLMLRVPAAAIVFGLLIACADNPPQYDLRKSIGPCIIGFDTEGDTWYAIPNRHPDPTANYIGGAYWAVMTIQVTNKGGTNPVTITAGPTDLRVPIPSLSPIFGAAQESCRAFDSPPVLLSQGKT